MPDIPYFTLNNYLKSKYGQKCYKVSINLGLSCPNRDGTLDTRGCIFCSAGGSGDFACNLSAGLDIIRNAPDRLFIVYFQAFTNTYGDLSFLANSYRKALMPSNVIGISIGTRPDCIDTSIVNLLSNLQKETGKFTWVELGLQTIHENTATYIRRHYPLSVYDKAVRLLNEADIPYVTHVILGLPGETKDMILDTVRYVTGADSYLGNPSIFGIKLQLLHVLSGTDLAEDYNKGLFTTLSLDEYIDILTDCIRNIPSSVTIHRVTGDGPRDLLISPRWSTNKKVVLNTLHKNMWDNGYVQGDLL